MDVKGINNLHSLSPPSKDHLKFIETGHPPAEVSCQHGKYILITSFVVRKNNMFLKTASYVVGTVCVLQAEIMQAFITISLNVSKEI
jgi:hypothetical protein